MNHERTARFTNFTISVSYRHSKPIIHDDPYWNRHLIQWKMLFEHWPMSNLQYMIASNANFLNMMEHLFFAVRPKQGKASFMLELKLRAPKKEPPRWRGASYTCLFTQIQFTQKLSTWENEVLDGALMDPIWNDYSSHIWQALSQNCKLPPWGSLGIFKSLNSCFVAPKPMDIQAVFGLSWMLLCFNSITPLISHFEHGTLHLLKLLGAWR